MHTLNNEKWLHVSSYMRHEACGFNINVISMYLWETKLSLRHIVRTIGFTYGNWVKQHWESMTWLMHNILYILTSLLRKTIKSMHLNQHPMSHNSHIFEMQTPFNWLDTEFLRSWCRRFHSHQLQNSHSSWLCRNNRCYKGQNSHLLCCFQVYFLSLSFNGYLWRRWQQWRWQ